MQIGCLEFRSGDKTNPFVPREIAGIYAIPNVLNQKVYVGSAISIYDRLYNHIWHLQRATHHNAKLLNAWRKYTPSAFSLEVLEIVELPNLLIQREPRAGSNLGRTFGPAARKSVAEATRKAMSDPTIRARVKQATIAAMSRPEIKTKCSEFLKKRWEDPAARSLMMSARHGNPKIKRRASLKMREARFRLPSEKLRENAIKNFHLTLEQRRQYGAQSLAKRRKRGEEPAARNYRVTFPDGQIVSIFNLKRFCCEHSIPYPSALNVLNARVRHARGYIFERIGQ